MAPGPERPEKDEDAGYNDDGGHYINQPVETDTRWLRQYTRTVIIDEMLLDLSFALAICQHATDLFAPFLAGVRGTNIQRSILADRTVQLSGDGIDFVVGDGPAGFLGSGWAEQKQKHDSAEIQHRFQFP